MFSGPLFGIELICTFNKYNSKYNLKLRFFIKAKMETHGRNLGYFHIEYAFFQSYDHDSKLLESYPMIEDGCNVNKLIQFKGKPSHGYPFGV